MILIKFKSCPRITCYVCTLKCFPTSSDAFMLQIQIANESFFGRYECQAKNNLGHISRIFDLQRGEKPAPPTSIEVVKVTVHTATFSLKGGSDRVGFRAQFVISRPGQEIDWTRSDYQDLTKSKQMSFLFLIVYV